METAEAADVPADKPDEADQPAEKRAEDVAEPAEEDAPPGVLFSTRKLGGLRFFSP